MRITCPNCGTGYDVADTAIGPQGRKVRCRACGASWVEGGVAAAPAPSLPAAVARPAEPVPPPSTAEPALPDPVVPARPAITRARLRWPRAPLIALSLVILAVALGIAVASAIMGPARLASEFGLAGTRVPLGIAITRPPDWREIAGDNQLFAISGRIWNPTDQRQPVPDVRAEIRNAKGRVVHEWVIARPAKELPPGGHVDFDGAAIDVPRDSATVALSFVGEKR